MKKCGDPVRLLRMPAVCRQCPTDPMAIGGLVCRPDMMIAVMAKCQYVLMITQGSWGKDAAPHSLSPTERLYGNITEGKGCHQNAKRADKCPNKGCKMRPICRQAMVPARSLMIQTGRSYHKIYSRIKREGESRELKRRRRRETIAKIKLKIQR
jgi:hypothetical protein